MTPPTRPYERQTSVRALRVGLGGPSLCACPRYRIPGRAISLLAAILVSEPRSAGSCLLAVWLTEAPSHILRDRLARRRRVDSRPLRPRELGLRVCGVAFQTGVGSGDGLVTITFDPDAGGCAQRGRGFRRSPGPGSPLAPRVRSTRMVSTANTGCPVSTGLGAVVRGACSQSQ